MYIIVRVSDTILIYYIWNWNIKGHVNVMQVCAILQWYSQHTLQQNRLLCLIVVTACYIHSPRHETNIMA